ncbi:hypothetical protein [Aphanothece sacrum]|uniref:hypothetical protein n=1 Tax=Aphanothece sacrum TaxID=1122 RepID=UPI001562AC98|nr:hypothetical protein [Aphanothece sacrum]
MFPTHPHPCYSIFIYQLLNLLSLLLKLTIVLLGVANDSELIEKCNILLPAIARLLEL